jgi:hypothetical protein
MRRFNQLASIICVLATANWMFVASAAAQIPRDPVLSNAGGQAPPAAAAPAQQPQAFVTKQNEVDIPFNVRAGATAESQPASVRVFVSWDRGKSWHFYDERKPEDSRFRFRAKQDGEFWFATQIIDRSGRPAGPEPRTPQLRLIVDTLRPQLLVQAHVDANGQVNLAWSAADATLKPASLKVEYQDAAGNGGPWQSVETGQAAGSTVTTTGQASFLPTVSGSSMNLRAEVADSAGNIAYFSQRVSLLPPKPKANGSLAYAPAADPSAVKWPTGKPATTERFNGESALAAVPKTNAADEAVKIPGTIENPFAGPGRLASTRPVEDQLPLPNLERHGASSLQEMSPQPVEPALPSQSLPSANTPSPSNVDTLPLANDIAPAPATIQTAPAAVTEIAPLPASPVEVMPTPQPPESIDPPTAQRPRLTNSRRFSLDYDIESVGPEGVSAVELWGTNDDGRTWSKWGTDPDKASPFDVEVNREAVYGFRIVVVGKNGLATSTPQPGDAADIWVGVDLTRPQAKLTGAIYGQGEAAGKLDISWQVEDVNLGSRPITLSISDRPDGRFTPIAQAIPNTGSFLWEYDPRSPRQIYLRLEARDDAGNIAIEQLTEPIKVEGLEPKAQIRGFSPAPPTGPAPPSSRKNYRTPLLQ